MRKNQRLLIAGILLLATAERGPGPGGVRSLRQRGDGPRGRRRGEGWRHRAVLEIGNAQWGNRHSEVFRPARGGDNGGGKRTGAAVD